MTMRRFSLLLTAVAMFSVVACASSDPSSSDAPAAPSSAAVPSPVAPTDAVPSDVLPSEAVPAPSAVDPGQPKDAPPGAGGKSLEIAVTGVVTAGVEPGCRLISDGRTSYLLLGGDGELAKVGARVTVTGTIGENVMSTCQQGTPLQVKSVKAA